MVKKVLLLAVVVLAAVMWLKIGSVFLQVRQQKQPFRVITGIVTKVDSTSIEIATESSKVRVKPAEKTGGVTEVSLKKDGNLVTKEISLADIKIGDRVEAHSLQVIGENSFSSRQIFVRK